MATACGGASSPAWLGVRDSSNGQARTVDLGAELTGRDGAYLRFLDSMEARAGARRSARSRRADGQAIASVAPGADAETPYIFDGVNSSTGGSANRFCDGGRYFLHRFTGPCGRAGTRELVMLNRAGSQEGRAWDVPWRVGCAAS